MSRTRRSVCFASAGRCSHRDITDFDVPDTTAKSVAEYPATFLRNLSSNPESRVSFIKIMHAKTRCKAAASQICACETPHSLHRNTSTFFNTTEDKPHSVYL